MDVDGERETQLLSALQGAYAMRGQAYGHFFDVLRERYGAEAALAIGQEATRRLGRSLAEPLKAHAPADLSGLCDTFLSRIPEPEMLFGPQVERCDRSELVIQFTRCPLKEAWLASGRSAEDVRLLCAMAGSLDVGLFEAAGFGFANETWQPGREGCCRLMISPGPPAA